MRTKTWLAGLGLALGLAVTSASAAPGGPVVSGVTTDAPASAVEQVHSRRSCYWRHGHRHCYRTWARPRVYYGYGYAYPRYYGHRHYGHGYYGRRHYYGGPHFSLRLW